MPKLLAAVAARYSATVVQFAISILIARQVSVADMGVYLSIFGLITSLSVLAGAGAADGIVRIYPELAERSQRRQADAVMASYLRFGLWTSCVLALALGGASLLLGAGLPLLLPATLWALGYAVMTIGSQALVAVGRTGLGTFLYYGSANWASLLAIGAWITLPGQIDLTEIVWAVAMGSLLAGGACMIFAWKAAILSEARSGGAVKAIVRIGVPMTSVRLAQAALIWSPVWVAGVFFGPDRAAIVGLASRLVMSVAAAVAALRFASRPQLVTLTLRGDWDDAEVLGRRMADFCAGLCVIVLVGNIALGRIVLPAIFGHEYRDVWFAVALLLVGIVFESAAGPSDEILKLTGAAGLVFYSQVVVLVVGVGVQCIFGVLGSASGVMVAASVAFGGLYIYYACVVARRYGVTPFSLGRLLRRWTGPGTMRMNERALF